MLFWWIDVACTSETGNRWIICFFIAMWLTLCGLLPLLVLDCLGLCVGKSLTCLLVGGRLEGRGVFDLEDGADMPSLVCLEGKKY